MLDWFLGLIGGFVGFMLGGWSMSLTLFIVFQLIDIISGLSAGAKHGELSSKVMKYGLYEKFGVWLLFVIAHFVDIILFDGQDVALTGVIFTFTGKEGLSIIENLARMGVYIPQQLGKYFLSIQEKGEGRTEDSDNESGV